MSIKVSVIIPVYNVEKFLNKCLNSVIQQTMQDIEIICVNDGSTDKSLDILKNFAKYDNRIVIIDQENQGLSAARNSGIKIAQGDFLSFIDSDDYIELDMFEEMHTKALKDKSDIVVCRFDKVNEEYVNTYSSGITNIFTKDELFNRILSGMSSPMACDKIYKRELFIKNKITYPVGLYHEDVPTTYKLFYFAQKISIIEKVFYHWLHRDGSISKRIEQKHIDDTFEIFKLTKEFLKEENIFEMNYKFFIRRIFHYSYGLIQKLNLYAKNTPDKGEKIISIIERMRKDGYETENNLMILKNYDQKLYNQYKDIASHIGNKNKNSLSLQECKNKLITIELELEDIYNSRAYKLIKKYYQYRDVILPIGSKRRNLIKNFLLMKERK